MNTPEQVFIEKASIIHNQFYNYSLVEYTTANKPVIIICPIHGQFNQKPLYHIQRKSGCPSCYRDRQRYTESDFISEASNKYCNKFMYGTYTGFRLPISIRCPMHGEFVTTPSNHLKGSGGCLRCKHDSQRKTKQAWIDQFNSFHSYRYDYSKATQISSEHKFEVICPNHGSFYPTANNHLNGHGCPTCAKLYKYVGGYSEGYFQKHPHKKTTIGTLYVIHCSYLDEQFIKIGITSQSITQRFASKLAPYKYEIVLTYTDHLYALHGLEQQLLRIHATYQYTPAILFSGWTECFRYDAALLESITASLHP